MHCDLKPGNVLVTPEAQVKLLDFGIAKALDPLDGTDADTTVGTARPFRSNYASPERVRGEPVTTATDFYSLGVLLYQLLTDVRPTGRLATTPAEAARSVLEDVLARPSSLPADLVADPHWLATRKRLEGDLDNLLMKALEKPVERRYASVDALAAAVSGAAAAVLALAAGLGVAAWQGHEARVARDEAQRRLADICSITRDLVFRFGDAVSYLPGGMKVKEDMLQDVLRSLDRLASSPDRDPALLADVATTYARLAELQGNDQALSLGKPEAARINIDNAIAIATDLLPRRRDDWKPAQWTARAHGTRSQVLRGQDKPREGIAELDLGAAVLARADLSNADDLGRVGVPAQRATMLIPEAQLLEQLAQRDNTAPTEALRKLDDAEAVLRPLFDQRPMLERPDLAGRPEEPKSYADVLNQTGVVVGARARVHVRMEQLDQALAAAKETLQLKRDAVAYDPATSVWNDGLATEASHLAVVHLRRGEFAPALEAVELARRVGAQLALDEGPASKWARQLPQLSTQQGFALAGMGLQAQAL